MNRAEEDRFAWALMEAAGIFLNECARSWLCAKLGAGETQSVIRDLLAGFASSSTKLPLPLAASLWSWANGFRGSDDEMTVREIIGKVTLMSGERLDGEKPAVPTAKLVARQNGSSTQTSLMLVPAGV